jgi:outer membrane scaffolding protein for murein synthesis (MipA/OmpV family)
MRKIATLSFLLACAAILATGEASAQEATQASGSHGLVAAGPGIVPEFDGSGDQRLIPFVIADVRLGGIDVEVRGLRGRADLAPDARFSIGPVLGARLPREDAGGAVGLLPTIDTAIEAGAFVGYTLGGDARGEGSVRLELSAVHDVSGTHDGLLATTTVSYAAVRRTDFFLSFDLQATWADKDYARTYFGIEPADAAASGLPVFRPGSGFRDVGAGLTAGYWFGRRIGVLGRLGAGYLVGEIGDSPVTEEGSRWQPTAGIALSYRF